jgi:hypothetical protein
MKMSREASRKECNNVKLKQEETIVPRGDFFVPFICMTTTLKISKFQ